MTELLNPIDGGQGTVVEAPTEATSTMDADNPSSDGQAGVVAPEAGVTPDADSDIAANPPQSREDNHAAKLARIRAEREAVAAAKQQQDAAISAMGLFDLNGAPITNMEQLQRATAAINAQKQEQLLQEQSRQTGVPMETLRAMRQMQADNQRLQGDNQQLQLQAAELQRQVNEVTFAEHLAMIKAAYPEVTAKHITELGDDFLQMMAAGRGLDPVAVYGALEASKAAKAKPVPPAIGSPKGAAAPAESEFFTAEEMAHLDYDRLLKDDSYYAKAMRTQKRMFGK